MFVAPLLKGKLLTDGVYPAMKTAVESCPFKPSVHVNTLTAITQLCEGKDNDADARTRVLLAGGAQELVRLSWEQFPAHAGVQEAAMGALWRLATVNGALPSSGLQCQ